VRDPRRALAAAREAAGPDGVALATGSIYLIADLLRPADATRRSTM
jgi:dihydrofolate synthase/folylpolyglutamate synthase